MYRSLIARLGLVILLGSNLACAGQPAPESPVLGFSIERLERVDNMAREYVDAGLLPAVMYGVVRSDGVVHTSSVGRYQQEDLFRIFSMTKPITAVATLMLMEEGKLLLTDPISRYLPEFAQPQVLLEDGTLEAARRPITVRHLLTHTAGFTYGGGSGAVSKQYSAANLWTAGSLEDFSKELAAIPLVAHPGEFWHYSVSLDVLGRVLEVAAGQPFEQYLQERLFAPLRMNDTGFSVTTEEFKRLVPLYLYRPGGMDPSPPNFDQRYLKPPFPAGGGGLISSLGDYMKFARMLLNDGELDGARILSRKSVAMMMSDHLLSIDPELKVNEAWLGRTENRSGSVNIGFGFGLGGAVVRDAVINGIPGSVGTYGWGGTGNTYFFVDREEDVSGVFFTQLRPSGSYAVRSRFRAMVYQALED